MGARGWIDLTLTVVLLGGLVVGARWADVRLRRRGNRGARVAVWSVTGLVLAVSVVVPLLGLLLLWYLGQAE